MKLIFFPFPPLFLLLLSSSFSQCSKTNNNENHISLVEGGAKILNLSSSKCGDDRLVPLIQKEGFKSLTNVHLRDANISDETALKIAAILTGSDMAILDLSVNGISGVGAKGLVDAAKGSRLNLLDLSHNTGIHGADAADAAVRVLKDEKTTRLNLTSHRIGDDGAQKIAFALNESLATYLNLAGNGIGDVGAKALAEALKDSQLTYLNLRNNEIGENGARALAESLEYSQLIQLDLDDSLRAFIDEKFLSSMKSRHVIYAKNRARLMNAIQTGNLNEIKSLMALPKEEIRLVGLCRRIAEKRLQQLNTIRIINLVKAKLIVAADENAILAQLKATHQKLQSKSPFPTMDEKEIARMVQLAADALNSVNDKSNGGPNIGFMNLNYILLLVLIFIQ